MSSTAFATVVDEVQLSKKPSVYVVSVGVPITPDASEDQVGFRVEGSIFNT